MHIDLLLWCRLGYRHALLLLRHEKLYMARTAHVRVDTSMSAVRASAHASSFVHLHMLYDHLIRIQAFGVSVRFSVLQERQHSHYRLAWPTTFCLAPLLRLCGAPNLTVIALEGNTAGLAEYLAVQLLCLPKRHAVDDIRGLKGVFKVAAKVRDLRFHTLG